MLFFDRRQGYACAFVRTLNVTLCRCSGTFNVSQTPLARTQARAYAHVHRSKPTHIRGNSLCQSLQTRCSGKPHSREVTPLLRCRSREVNPLLWRRLGRARRSVCAHRSTARTRPHARSWPAGATRVNSRREGTQAKGQSTAKAATVNCLEWHVIASASRFHTRRRMCTIRRTFITLCVATAEAENNRPC